MIGGGDWSENRVIPDSFKAWSKNIPVSIRSPNSTRPWQHVLEVLSGYLNLAVNLKNKSNLNGEVFNFGPRNYQNKKVIDVINEIKKYLPTIKVKINKKRTFSESNLLKLNSSKAFKRLNWSNKLLSVKQLNDFSMVRKVLQKKNMVDFTSKQIKEFEQNYESYNFSWW